MFGEYRDGIFRLCVPRRTQGTEGQEKSHDWPHGSNCVTATQPVPIRNPSIVGKFPTKYWKQRWLKPLTHGDPIAICSGELAKYLSNLPSAATGRRSE